MAQLILKPEIVEEIKNNQILFGEVAKALGISIRTLFDLLPKNPPRLATASVLQVLRERLNITQDSELLEEMQEPEPKTAIA